jgi:hypothetical protein
MYFIILATHVKSNLTLSLMEEESHTSMGELVKTQLGIPIGEGKKNSEISILRQ